MTDQRNESQTASAPKQQSRTFTVSDLVDLVATGSLRIPTFQRDFKWGASDVSRLFDSIYQGYPIGTLLFWAKPAEAAEVHIGTLTIQASKTTEAYWVVDGQQRVVSLSATLLGAEGDPKFRLAFDLENERFERNSAHAPEHWLPLTEVLDTTRLLQWLRNYTGPAEHIGKAEKLAKAIREYTVPAYIQTTDNETRLRTIFDRLNGAGKRMTQAEVFQALHSGDGRSNPADLRSLSDAVATKGFGRATDEVLFRSVMAIRGDRVYRDFRTEFANEDPGSAFQHAEDILGRVIVFLRDTALIPHFRLVPYALVMPVLSRFFSLHPEPSQRSLTLLRRWLWRGAVVGIQPDGFTPALRRNVRAVTEDEDESVKALLSLVPKVEWPAVSVLRPRLNHADTRLQLAALASLQPINLETGEEVDVASLIDQQDTEAIVPIAPARVPNTDSLANRVLHPSAEVTLEELVTSPTTSSESLQSHCLDEKAVDLLSNEDYVGFLTHRSETLSVLIDEFRNRMAEVGHTDRPPLSSLIVEDSDD